VPAPGRHDGATRPPHLAPSASPTPPRPRRLGGAGARDSDGACVPFSRLGLHQSERCGHPTDDVRGPVPAPGRHDGRDAASASRALGQRAGSSYVPGRARFGPLRRRRRKRARSAMRTVSYYIRCDAATCSRRAPPHRNHSKLAPLLSPPPPRRFGQELLETSDLSIRRPYSELAPCRAARGELRGQSAPSAVSGSVAPGYAHVVRDASLEAARRESYRAPRVIATQKNERSN
jgi:hypothetical protein